MKYTVRIARFGDLEAVSAIEKATMDNYTYVDTAWNYFFNTKGDFLCAYNEDDTMVAIAHLAVLPDNSCWFEALRVHPDHQNQGAGKALYEKAIDLAQNRYHCTAMSMYTGPRNVRSSGLAARYGLSNVYNYKEYTYKINKTGNNGDYRYADWRRAFQLALPLKEEYGDFISINRTMCRINSDNISALADKRLFYEDGSGSFICIGNRFQHGNKIFLVMLGGDYGKGLDFAVSLANARNIPEITCTFTSVNNKLEKALQDYGFTFVADIITRERIF